MSSTILGPITLPAAGLPVSGAIIFSLTIQFEESDNIQPSPTYVSGCDWDAYDIDAGSQSNVIQYSYGHAFYGPCLLAFTGSVSGLTWSYNAYRYNIFGSTSSFGYGSLSIVGTNNTSTHSIAHNNTLYTHQVGGSGAGGPAYSCVTCH